MLVKVRYFFFEVPIKLALFEHLMLICPISDSQHYTRLFTTDVLFFFMYVLSNHLSYHVVLLTCAISDGQYYQPGSSSFSSVFLYSVFACFA